MKNSKLILMGLLVSGVVLTGCQTEDAESATEEKS